MPQDLKIPFGLTSEGDLITPNQAHSGSNCGAYCPDPNCRQPLTCNKGRKRCKNGQTRRSYFSHAHSKSTCSESAIHLAAKRLLSQYPQDFRIPEFTHKGHTTVFSQLVPIFSTTIEKKIGKLIVDGLIQTNFRETRIQRSWTEKQEKYFGPLIIECRSSSPTVAFPLSIEFAYTNFKNDESKQKFKEQDLNCIEIDLTKFNMNGRDSSIESLKDFIFNEASNRKWIYCNLGDAIIPVIDCYYESLEKKTESPQPKIQVPTTNHSSSFDTMEDYYLRKKELGEKWFRNELTPKEFEEYKKLVK